MPRRTAAIQQPPLWFAASKGDIQQARALVLSGVNIEEVGGRAPFRETPLETAVEEGYFEMAQMLLDNGADIHSRNVTDGGSLLHGTVKHSSTGMALLLINNGADVSALDDNGQTPLHRVAQTHFGRHPMYRDLGMVAARLLLDHGAHVSAIDNFGRTPLHWAALHGYTPVVRQLLESGADVSITDNEGATAGDLLPHSQSEQHTEARGVLETEMRERANSFAFMMGHHPRLGVSSRVRDMDPEVLRMVLNYV